MECLDLLAQLHDRFTLLIELTLQCQFIFARAIEYGLRLQSSRSQE